MATEACSEKSNEIKAIPGLIDKINISGKIVTADAMSMQKNIIDRIRENGCDFLIELEANQPSLRYGVEDRLKECTPALGSLVRNHWSIESMHWALDFNLLQDRIKRKSAKAARNLDSIQRIVHSVFSIWKRLRKKRSDKKKGMAELMRYVSMSFTRLLRFLHQK